jgi:hypothetical protein
VERPGGRLRTPRPGSPPQPEQPDQPSQPAALGDGAAFEQVREPGMFLIRRAVIEKAG